MTRRRRPRWLRAGRIVAATTRGPRGAEEREAAWKASGGPQLVRGWLAQEDAGVARPDAAASHCPPLTLRTYLLACALWGPRAPAALADFGLGGPGQLSTYTEVTTASGLVTPDLQLTDAAWRILPELPAAP